MTTPEAGDPNQFNETFLIPDGNDYANPTILNVPSQALANRTQWLRDKLFRKPIWPPLFSARDPADAYVYSDYNNRFGLQQAVVDGTYPLFWHVKIPVGAYLHRATAYVICEPSPLTVLPSTMPELNLFRQPTDGSQFTQIANIVDQSATPSAFNAYHTISEGWATAPTLGENDLLVVAFSGMVAAPPITDALKLVAVKLEIDPSETVVSP